MTDLKQEKDSFSKILLTAGICFLLMEAAKQAYLCMFCFPGGTYNVWYFPFQICSMPIYLCTAAGISGKKREIRADSAVTGFLADYGFLGGIMALIVNEGFTSTGHAFLTVHGYIWHIGMIVLAVFLQFKRSFRGLGKEILLFAGLSFIALVINIFLHPFGDADMFYISPYHFSVQPVFGDIERFIGAPLGRPFGIIFYLAMTALGASIVRLIFFLILF